MSFDEKTWAKNQLWVDLLQGYRARFPDPYIFITDEAIIDNFNDCPLRLSWILTQLQTNQLYSFPVDIFHIVNVMASTSHGFCVKGFFQRPHDPNCHRCKVVVNDLLNFDKFMKPAYSLLSAWNEPIKFTKW